MSRHQIHDVGTVLLTDSDPTAVAGPAPWSARLSARLFAGRYDHQIEDGASPPPGSPLALHSARLVSARERDDLACALQWVVHDADGVGARFNARVPVQCTAVRHAAGVIDVIRERLADPFPVRARGMARLRIVLSDGCGPLYRSGQGTLAAALRGVLATL